MQLSHRSRAGMRCGQTHPVTGGARHAIRFTVVAALAVDRTAGLKQLLARPGILKGPCCHDALSARLIERAGFDFAFMSGFCTSAARLGAPDTGLISYGEMVDQGRYVHEATRTLPIIGDGDTGYGNALNVKRTVRGYAAAGFAGILIEDQLWPKSCGHVRGKRVAPRDEALARIRAAVDAREEGANILILARSDARQAESLDEALWRAAAFADAGADLLFIDALASEQEMRAFTGLGGAAAGLPKMANMLEGGGKTPILSPDALQGMGFKLVAYPLSLLGVSIRAMDTALAGLARGEVPPPDALGSFADIQAAVGFPEYFEEEDRYAAGGGGGGGGRSGGRTTPTPSIVVPSSSQPPTAAAPAEAAVAADAGSAGSASTGTGEGGSSSGADASISVVEPDSVVEPSADAALALGRAAEEADRQTRWDAFRRSKFFRVNIRDRRSGYVKLETRIPAGFLGGLTALIPQVGGVDFEAMLESAMGGRLDVGKPLLDVESGDDAITVYLE